MHTARTSPRSKQPIQTYRARGVLPTSSDSPAVLKRKKAAREAQAPEPEPEPATPLAGIMEVSNLADEEVTHETEAETEAEAEDEDEEAEAEAVHDEAPQQQPEPEPEPEPLAEADLANNAARALMDAAAHNEKAARGKTTKRSLPLTVTAVAVSDLWDSDVDEEEEGSEASYAPDECAEVSSEDSGGADSSSDDEDQPLSRRQQFKKARLTKSPAEVLSVQQQKANAIKKALSNARGGIAKGGAKKAKAPKMIPLDEHMEKMSTTAAGCTANPDYAYENDPACIALGFDEDAAAQLRDQLADIHQAKGKLYGAHDKRNNAAAVPRATIGQYVEGYQALIRGGVGGVTDLRSLFAWRKDHAGRSQKELAIQVVLPELYPDFCAAMEAQGLALDGEHRVVKRVTSWLSGVGQGKGAPSKLSLLLERADGA